MALVPDQKFSTFQDGGDLAVNDIIVGLRDGLNTQFTYTGELPPGVIVPISQGGTGATTALQACTNLGLGTGDSPQFTNLRLTGGGLYGLNNNLVLNLADAANAVNYVSLSNSPTGAGVGITPMGVDPNIVLILTGKGTGATYIGGVNPTTPVRILNGAGFQHTTDLVFANTAANRAVTFQDANGTVAFLSDVAGTVTTAQGTANQVLVNGTSGSAQTGACIFTLPQSIGTSSSVQFQQLSFSDYTKGILGTGTNDAASSGYVGELITSSIASGSAVNVPNNTATNITSIVLTPGDWDVWGNVAFQGAPGTISTLLIGALSTTSTDFSSNGARHQHAYTSASGTNTFLPIDAQQVKVTVATTTTIYLNCYSTFSVSTMGAYGIINARRRR